MEMLGWGVNSVRAERGLEMDGYGDVMQQSIAVELSSSRCKSGAGRNDDWTRRKVRCSGMFAKYQALCDSLPFPSTT